MPPKQVLTRTLHTIHVGAVQSMQRKQQQDTEYDLIEIELQYHVPIQGSAGTLLTWTEPVSVEFEWGFHYAPMQRDSDLELPHFTYGAYVVTETPVGLLACITGWQEERRNGSITGADVSIGVIGHDPAAPVDFQGYVHASFQGLAQSRDETSENPDLEVTR